MSATNLTLKKLVMIASIMLGLGFFAAIATNSVALSQLRVGGSVYNDLKGDFDLLADIMPPPIYVIDPYLEATLLLKDGQLERHRQRLSELHRQYDERKAYWEAQKLDDSERPFLQEASRTADAFWTELDGQFLPALARNDKAAAETSYGALTKAYEEHRAAIDSLVGAGKASLVDSQKSAGSATTFYMVIVWGISGLLLVLLAVCIYGARSKIVSPLLDFTRATKDLANGNLQVDIPALGRHDELGDLAGAMATFRDKLIAAERSKAEQTEVIVSSIGAGLDSLAKGDLTHRVAADLSGPFSKLKHDFNAAMDHLQDTLKNVRTGTGQITSGAGEISQASDDLSRRTEQQAASLEETAAALEEITATVKKTAANAKEARASVTAAKGAAENGGRVVETAIKAMDSISQSSKQITDIIGVIDEIAFQTNLLALNAGVEAARAGDAGKGFAVVASEVRALAQRSSEAAKEIKALINTSGAHVEDGVKLVGESGEALRQIVNQVEQINSLVSEMALAAEQQSTGIEQVNAAVGQMDQVTQQNAAMVEQSTAASRNLAAEAVSLNEIVGIFNVGSDASARPRSDVRLARAPVAPAAAKVRATAAKSTRPTAVASAPRAAHRGSAALARKPAPREDDWTEF